MPVKYTLDQILELIPTVRWFDHSGGFVEQPGTLGIYSLAPAVRAEKIKDEDWKWLPSQKWEMRPGDASLLNRVKGRDDGKELLAQCRYAHKLVVAAMHSLPHVSGKFSLADGHFLRTAKGAAATAFLMAAAEAQTLSWGQWSFVVALYAQGYWPCGVSNDGKIVVY